MGQYFFVYLGWISTLNRLKFFCIAILLFVPKTFAAGLINKTELNKFSPRIQTMAVLSLS
jgi:hypothetical protein